jgi:hypothetical protein
MQGVKGGGEANRGGNSPFRRILSDKNASPGRQARTRRSQGKESFLRFIDALHRAVK